MGPCLLQEIAYYGNLFIMKSCLLQNIAYCGNPVYYGIIIIIVEAVVVLQCFTFVTMLEVS
jgi:hypothetical protein